MQAKSENYSEFSDRTERLAARLEKNLNDLPPLIGISPAMFYAYRTGKYKISPKAWRKLEAVETENGLNQTPAPGDRVATLCEKIRSEFYLPTDSDFLGLAANDHAEVLRAMADSIDEMERRQAAYAARARREGLSKNAAADAEADKIIADAEAEVKGSKVGHRSHGALRKAS